MKIYWNRVELGWAIFRVNAICLRCVHLFYFAPVCTLGGPPMISDICLVELHSKSPPHLGKFNFSELISIICAPHLAEEGRTLDSPADTSWLRNPQWGSLVGSRWTLKHFHFLGMCLTDKSIEYFWSSLNLVFQLPGTFERADVTDVLARRTFWPSYNSPYFPGPCHSYVFS